MRVARRRPGTGSVERRGGSFELRYFREDGKRARKVLGRADEIDEAEARRRADDLLYSLRGADHAGEFTVARMIEELGPVMRSCLAPNTVYCRTRLGNKIARFFVRRPARTIDVRAAQDFMATLAGLANNTIRDYRRMAVQLWTLGHERGLLGPENPWRAVRVPRAEDCPIVPLRRGDAELLAPFLDPDEADLMRFLCETGLRIGEATRLRWDDVREGRVLVRKSKNGRSRAPVLSSAALAVLASIRLRDKVRDRIFPIMEGRRGYYRVLGHVQSACEFAGLERMSFHCARHGFACDLADAGVAERDLAAALGQRDQESAVRYTNDRHPDAGADRAIRRLEAHRAASARKAE